MGEKREQPKKEDVDKIDALIEGALHKMRAIRFCVKCMVERSGAKK